MSDSFSVRSIGAELEENLERVQLLLNMLLLDNDWYGISYFSFRIEAIVITIVPVSRWCTLCVIINQQELYQDESIAFKSTMSNASMCKIEWHCDQLDWWVVLWPRTIITDDSCSIQSLHMTLFYLLRLKFICEFAVILMHVWHEPVLKSDNILSFFPYILGKICGPCNNYEESYYNFTSFVHCFKSQCLSHATVYGLYELYLWETLQFCSKFASRPCSFGQFLHVP